MKRTPKQVRRLSVAEAKAKLSEALREAEGAPTFIHNRGRDVAVLLGVDAYERLVADAGDAVGSPVAAFLDDVASLKERLAARTSSRRGRT